MSFSIGRSGFHLSAVLNSREKNIGVEIFISHDSAKIFFEQLKDSKTDIEAKLGHSLVWQDLPNRKGCRIAYKRQGWDPMDENKWPDYIEWLKENLENFSSAFRPYIRGLDSDDWGRATEEDEAQVA